MNLEQVAAHRLRSQQLSGTKLRTPAELVAWQGAMQAQEYAMAKWAIGLRLAHLNDADVEQAFNAGEILRTHVLRPTWHFVAPADIRWMLKLSAPRVHAVNASMGRKLELDASLLHKCSKLIVRALEGEKYLTREQLQTTLAREKIELEGQRMAYVAMHAELEGLICSGPRIGKQFSYALLDERVAYTAPVTREQALAALAERYFQARGPASAQDFAVWSGLTLKDVREAIGLLGRSLVEVQFGEQSGWMYEADAPALSPKGHSFLMPDYDEYGIGFKDRSALFASGRAAGAMNRDNPIFNRMLIVDGTIAGCWKRTLSSTHTYVQFAHSSRPSRAAAAALKASASRFANFLGLQLELQ